MNNQEIKTHLASLNLSWDNTPLFVKYNPGIPDLLDLFVLDLFTNEWIIFLNVKQAQGVAKRSRELLFIQKNYSLVCELVENK